MAVFSTDKKNGDIKKKREKISVKWKRMTVLKSIIPFTSDGSTLQCQKKSCMFQSNNDREMKIIGHYL